MTYKILLTLVLIYFCSACASHTRSSQIVFDKSMKSQKRICMPQQKSQKWAVVVGIDQYKDTRISSLKGASHDAWSFYHYLIAPHGGNIPKNQSVILLNWQATRANLEFALGQFLANACPQDSIYIYFAGHGAPEPNIADEAFLLTHDTQLDNLVGTAISMRQLPRFLSWRAGKTGKLMMFVDACHAGRLSFPGQRGIKMNDRVTEERGFDSKRSTSVHNQIESLAKSEPQWNLFAAASAKQVAVESKQFCPYSQWDYQGGLFTCMLLQALSGKADQNNDGSIQSAELYQFVTHQVDQQTKGAQRPQWSGPGIDVKAIKVSDQSAFEVKSTTLDLPKLQQPLSIPSIPKYYMQKPTSGPSTITWSFMGATAVSTGVSAYLVGRTNQEADQIASNLNGLASYEVDQQNRSRYNEHRTNSYIALGISSGLALTSIGLWAYDYYKQRKTGKKSWFKIVPIIQTSKKLADISTHSMSRGKNE